MLRRRGDGRIPLRHSRRPPRTPTHGPTERTEWNQAFSDACEANSDGILPFITTENSARDMDLLRAVLGDKELNYLGYSYGTFLGATYAKLYPERVGRLVLDGAVDPAVSIVDVNTTQAIGFESALRAYMADCLQGSDCPFRGTVDEGMADLGTMLASVEQSPLPAADGRLLGADSLLTGIIAALYAQEQLALPHGGAGGRASGRPRHRLPARGLLLQPGRRRVPRQLHRSLPRVQLHGLSDRHHRCGAGRLRCARSRPRRPTVAPYWSGPDPCDGWPYPPTGARGEIAAAGAAPIVVVGTTNDPATPYEWSVSLADQLRVRRADHARR